jgi:cytochrome c peroxidase
MHDGSVPSLEAAITHYASGGVATPLRSPLIPRFRLSGTEAADLLAFLKSLTDEEFVRDPTMGPPKGGHYN